MKKILIGTCIGVGTAILGMVVFMGIIAHDNFYARNNPANEYWYW